MATMQIEDVIYWVKGIEAQMKKMDILLSEVREWRNPIGVESRFEDAINNIVRVNEKMIALENKLQNFLYNSPIEKITDDELKNLYKKSNVQLKNIAEKFGVTMQRASQYINGNVIDDKIRHNLKMYLVENAKI